MKPIQKEELNKIQRKLVEEYRGLRVEDLNPEDPIHSCVLCGNFNCDLHNTPGQGCSECVNVTESVWISFYNFINPSRL